MGAAISAAADREHRGAVPVATARRADARAGVTWTSAGVLEGVFADRLQREVPSLVRSTWAVWTALLRV
jgi:hypothetical protein